MQLLVPLLLLLQTLNRVSATSFKNVTVDDTSKDIVYGGSKFQCNTGNLCGIEGSFNEGTTFTNGSLTFRFTGVAYYAAIDVLGSASVQLDGVEPGTALGSPGTITRSISATGLSNKMHTLSIHPTPGTIIGFDSLIYTKRHHSHHTGAIAGGVIGGFALLSGILLAVVYRRRLILRRNLRKGDIIRKMDLAWQNHSTLAVGEEDAKDVVFDHEVY